MGCITNYSCPVTIPTGATGADGNDGAAGANGASVYKNTVGTDYASVGTGDQSLTTYSHTGGIEAAGDIMKIKAIFSVSTTFVGTLYVKFGASTIATYTVVAGDALPPDPSALYTVTFDTDLYIKTTSTETYKTQTKISGAPVTILETSLINIAVNTAVAVTIDARCTPTAGTVTLKALTVINFVKV